jgi:phytoene dehydrogenase-like protein
MTKYRYDIVVAGGGHNSLITADYLANAGYKVGVIEAMQEVGGNCVTDELFPGYFFDTCASAHSQIQSNPVISRNELGLRDFGLEYVLPDLKSIAVFKGGDSIVFWKDIDATVSQIESYSKADGDAYRKLLDDVRGLRELFQIDATTPGGVPPESSDPVHLKATRFLSLSAYDVIKERFRNPVVQASLLAKAALTIYPVNYPGSARSLIAGIVGNHLGAWATPKGGAGQLTKALRRLLEARGAEIHCGQQGASLIIEGDRCVGVSTAEGEEFLGDKAVISTIHVKQLVDMAPRQLWGEGFVFGVETFQAGFTLFAQYLATTEPPLFDCRDGARSAICGELPFSVEDLIRGAADHVLGRFNPRAGLVVHTGSVLDGGRAPDGRHTVKIVGPQPYDLAETGAAGWDARKDEYADAILAEVRAVAPNLTDDKIVHRSIKSPLDLERRNLHNYRGSCHGGSSLPSQSGHLRPVPGWAQHRMPIKGLYQTGSTTHPGGGISGHPGRNAARVVLQDLGTSLEAVVASASRPRD